MGGKELLKVSFLESKSHSASPALNDQQYVDEING
jgi:hypothetical protein